MFYPMSHYTSITPFSCISMLASIIIYRITCWKCGYIQVYDLYMSESFKLCVYICGFMCILEHTKIQWGSSHPCTALVKMRHVWWFLCYSQHKGNAWKCTYDTLKKWMTKQKKSTHGCEPGLIWYSTYYCSCPLLI